jgi:hypothetical protein
VSCFQVDNYALIPYVWKIKDVLRPVISLRLSQLELFKASNEAIPSVGLGGDQGPMTRIIVYYTLSLVNLHDQASFSGQRLHLEEDPRTLF